MAATVTVPGLPLTVDGNRFPLRNAPPAPGADTRAVLEAIGVSGSEIDALAAKGIIVSA